MHHIDINQNKALDVLLAAHVGSYLRESVGVCRQRQSTCV